METAPRNHNIAEREQKSTSTALKVVVLVILLALLVIGILLPIKLVPNAVSTVSSKISNIFSRNSTVTLTTNKSSIVAGEAFTISWNGKRRANGSYSLSYPCKAGVRFETSVNQPNETIVCDNTYYFQAHENSVNITPFSDIMRFVDVPVTLGFLENGTSEVKDLGTIVITITNTKVSDNRGNPTVTTKPATTTPVKPVTVKPEEKPATTPTPTKTTVNRVSNPNGTADFKISILSSGYMNGYSYIPSYTVPAGTRAAVKFIVTNVGDKNTGTWSFTANLPSSTNPSYTAYNQQNLGPGDSIEYTLGFDNVYSNQNANVTITVDPSNVVREVSEVNNSASVTILTTGGTPIPGYGKADLSVRVLDTGVIDRYTGQYRVTTNLSSQDRAAVRFEVTNIGGQTTGSWRFTANLPTSDSTQFYTSAYQTSLTPGQGRIFTLGFDNLQYQGNNTVSVTIDSDNQVDELRNDNNFVSATIYRY